jgi:hypothetical protein
VPCGMLGDDGQPPGLAADVSWQGGYSRPGRWQRLAFLAMDEGSWWQPVAAVAGAAGG